MFGVRRLYSVMVEASERIERLSPRITTVRLEVEIEGKVMV